MKTRHVKTIAFIAAPLMLAVPNNADAQTMTVWQKSGEMVVFNLSEKPKTVFNGEDITISTPRMVVTYPFSQIAKYTFDEESSGIMTTKNDNPISVKQDGHTLIVEGLRGNTIISVYKLDGSKRFAKSTKEKTYQIPESALCDGVNIVKINNVSFKVVIK